MELAACSHAVSDPVNGERHNFEEDMFVNLHNEHMDAGSVDKVDSEVHINSDTIELQHERQSILKKLSFIRQQAALSSQDPVDPCSDQCVPEDKPVNANFSCDTFGATLEDKITSEERHGDYAEVSTLFIQSAFFHYLISSDNPIPNLTTIVPLCYFVFTFSCSCDRSSPI